MAIMLGGREHITISECADRLGVGYRTAYAYVMTHSEIPKQKIGRQFFVCYEDLHEHPRFVGSVKSGGTQGALNIR
jgi:excisionase family DNA binding protein